MLQYIAPSVIIISGLMHLFCCGIPLLLSIISLVTILDLSSVSVLHVEWFEAIEQEVIIASGVVLFTTIAVNVISRRLNCHADVGCCEAPCDDKKSFSGRLLWFAGILYLLNVLTLLIA